MCGPRRRYKYSPPLAVHLVWNCSDDHLVQPIINVVRRTFSRDKDKPFSRGLNIPLFFFSSPDPDAPPQSFAELVAEKNIILVFTSANTVGRERWRGYVESLPSAPGAIIIPVAVDSHGLKHAGSFASLNCIRAYDWSADDQDLQAILHIAHEVQRHGCMPAAHQDAGKSSSVTIFLSHAKAGDTGRMHAEAIKSYIDNTNLNRFFDSTEISPGFSFGQEIERALAKATLVAIETDAYSSRYWCQREILCAKRHGRPIVVVDSLSEYEDRIFPAASNVPRVHVSPVCPITQRDVLRILSAAMVETLRHDHAMQSLEFYQEIGWVEDGCELSPRPPEIRQALRAKGAGKRGICYPEPPIYSDEADWHGSLGVETFTPLWRGAEEDVFADHRVGISISDVEGDGFSNNHFHTDQLVRLAQDIARHLMARAATIIYGGDLRPGGFTEFILDEASVLRDRIGDTRAVIENYLARPLYSSNPGLIEWRARYSQVMKSVECGIPPDVASLVDASACLDPNSPGNSYVWSRCLTSMREQSVGSSTVRICAGGKVAGYMGTAPGVLEEILIALESKKPIFLIGAFGGVVRGVSDVLLEGEVPAWLNEDWQSERNAGYSETQRFARDQGFYFDYEMCVETLKSVRLDELASRVGLSLDEYTTVMRSPFIDECLHLVIKGLKSIRMA